MPRTVACRLPPVDNLDFLPIRSSFPDARAASLLQHGTGTFLLIYTPINSYRYKAVHLISLFTEWVSRLAAVVFAEVSDGMHPFRTLRISPTLAGRPTDSLRPLSPRLQSMQKVR